MKRKGQFFIISAVIIMLALFALNSNMNTDWNSDVSESQANDLNLIFRNLGDGINASVEASSPENLEENLNKLALAEKNQLKGRYDINIYYNITPAYVQADVTLRSNKIYVEKTLWAYR